MEDLVDSNLQIKLSIKEGKKFDNISQPTIIVATLNNHSLETDLIQPDSNPQYLTDLVWETEKKSLRKMRSGQTPLKIECFTLNEDGNREKVGYILLSIRCAQLIPKNKKTEVKMNWHTLLGLKSDLKSCKPELLFSLTIEERENVPEMIKTSKDSETLSSSQQNIVPLLLEDERLIQLGSLDTCHDIFLLNITAGTATNVDILIKEPSQNELINDLSFWYHIMDNDIRLKPFKINSENLWTLNEKIVIKIRSSLRVLKNYLQTKPYLYIILKFKEETIAHSKIDIRSLVPTNCINEFLKITNNASTILEQRCDFLNDDKMFNVQEIQPSLGLKLKFQYVGLKNVLVENYDEDNPYVKLSGVNCHRNPAGDFEKCRITKNFFEFNPKNNSSSENDCSKSIEVYHCYCLNIYINAIKLFSPSRVARNIEFRFHHPKTEILSTLCPKMPVLSGEKLRLQNVGCKLHFISSPNEIRNLLLVFPPKVSVCDNDDDAKTVIAQTIFDVTKLFNQNKPECQYEALLVDADQTEVGNIEVMMNLEDHGPYYKNKKKSFGENLGPPILDDTLAYKIVDELETWKERQKEIFNFELKRKEELHLQLLCEEWQKRKENLESKLACSMEQCKVLANSLNNATEDLRIRRLKSFEKETRLVKTNEELQKKYESKLEDFREAAEKMKSNFASKLIHLENRGKSLESQIEILKVENETLQQTAKQQAEELQVLEKGSLTQNQLASVLQEVKELEEKLAHTQKSKSFFKEQWAKAVREIHRIKTEHQHSVEMQIKSSKEELRNLNLEEILCADSEALTTDQILLNQMQREIDVIRPKSAHFQKEQTYQNFVPVNNVFSKSSRSLMRSEVSGKSEEYDERLRMLFEERDLLLKTGSYTINDEVIDKLNTEIRSLLISN